MSWGGPGFVLAIIAISTIGWVMTSWIRARHGYPLEDSWCGKDSRSDLAMDRKAELLANESDRLKGQIGRLEERVAVLERIVTDGSFHLDREIEGLRAKID